MGMSATWSSAIMGPVSSDAMSLEPTTWEKADLGDK